MEHSTCLQLNIKARKVNAPVLFLDLDNTLYPKALDVGEQMAERIRLFFEQRLGLRPRDAAELGRRFYLDYGLAVRGLVSHFDVDTADYDAFVDGGLDLSALESAWRDDNRNLHVRAASRLRETLAECTARLWVFTNAGVNHTRRVLDALDVSDMIEGVSFCDYAERDFPAKPDAAAYVRAMAHAGVRPAQCYLADDSPANVRAASDIGWRAVLVDEDCADDGSPGRRPCLCSDAEMRLLCSGTCPGRLAPAGTGSSVGGCSTISTPQSAHSNLPTVRSVLELPHVFPEIFGRTRSPSE